MHTHVLFVCLFMTLASIGTTNAQVLTNGTLAMECRVVPSAGVCRDDQKRTYWTYNTNTQSCGQIYGCYSVRDRNVFLAKTGCENNCMTSNTDTNGSVRIASQCRLNPAPGRCDQNQRRTYWSYSSKSGTCVQVTGCYSTNDRNIWSSRDLCRRGCFISGSGSSTTSGAATLPAFVGDRTTTDPVTLPANEVSIRPECRLNPSPGACTPGESKTWYTFSAKTGGCVRIYGCYNVRDRNVFRTDDGCRQRCLVSAPTPGQEWKRDAQCYLNPTPGRCAANQRRSFYTYSSKLKSCTQITGCYELRDRNVFQDKDNCNRMCVGNQMLPEVSEKFTTLQGVKIALECRVSPSPGRCTNGEQRAFFSYSSKTGDCAQIFGCYGLRDRNVFLNKASCRRSCFVSDSNATSDGMQPQCYVNPAAGRCPESQKTRYWSYSSKTGGCQQIYGCYSIRDRNVFLTKKNCQEACSAATNLPVRPEGQVNVECMVNPTPGRCRDQAKRQYYSYSSKTGTCTALYGCYGLRDRNVFMTMEGCNRNCFQTGDTTLPSGERNDQCYLVPSPGRCQPNQRRVYYSYSPKVDNCAKLSGCYSIRDRNVFITRKSCMDTCGIVNNSTSLVRMENVNIALECQLNPSPGNCRESEKRRYYTYSGKTRRCTQIYGCYSIRDRNVFLTESGCRQNCFLGDDNVPSGERDSQCLLIPAQGRCRDNEKTNYWSYSPKIDGCAQIYGCYSVRDRNVFITRDGCKQMCAVNTTSAIIRPDNVRVSIECRVNPSPGQCRPGDTRRYYTYSSKTGSCVQIDGCYSVRDRNVFVSRDSCRQNCFISDSETSPGARDRQCFINPAAGICPESQKRTFWTYSSKIDACTQIYGCYSVRDRNTFMTRDQCRQTCAVDSSAINGAPDNTSVAIECLVNPSPGNCQNNQRTTYYTYSAKTGSCIQIYGCYSVRDRNVFVTENSCRQNCFVSDTSTPSGGRDNQCYLVPSPGRCMESQKRSYWTYSPKIDACTQVYGCYSLRDRNVFLTRPSCEQTCAVDTNSGFDLTVNNRTLASGCMVNPMPGVCRENERTRYFSYSSKIGACTQIYGCYSIRDRNVFLTRENCRQYCYATDNPSGGRESQCFINPSPGRCRESERRSYWTFSSKMQGCVQVYGCYTVRDRNVFYTRSGCEQTCAVDTSVVIPDGNQDIAPECRLNPTPGNCRDNERTRYYTYSSKTASCIQVFGCYSIRDRNVFLTRDNCRRNCFISDGGRPTDRPDMQCYLSPTPGQCMPSERRTYWTYSSRTRECERIYGCYSIRDRNVYLTQNSCENICIMSYSTTPLPVFPTTTIPMFTTVPPPSFNPECRFNPSPGFCRDAEKRQYYSYSSKTESCVPLYGCYDLRDRNVYLTREGCDRGCFRSETPSGNRDSQCYINASPGRCAASDRRTYYTFSSKTTSCVQIYGCYSNRDRNVFYDRDQCRRACVNGIFNSGDTSSLTDLAQIKLENGLRLTRECQIIPTPGICHSSQERTFWSFSTKTMSCVRMTGCYDIHDRNTWMTNDGCIRNCFVNDSAPVVPGVTPLECQMNPTPGRCLPSEQRTYWSYNLKLSTCIQITGCYDFHDRNVWGSRGRCETKCRVMKGSVLPTPLDGNVDTMSIASECHVNPPPGRCLESEKLTYWSFSMKTGTCIRIRGCYSIRDRNTWLTRDSCQSSCILTDPNNPPSDKTPLGCRLIPSPGRCLESQRKIVWTYSVKLGACIEIIGCYNFHDRNVWRNRENCNEKCHVTSMPMFPDLADYDVDLECQFNPSPGMCRESEQRSYYAFSTKAMACVEIYGCYTINDRNVWYTRTGCLNSCLVPKDNSSMGRPVAPGCRVTPDVRQCRPGQKTNWWRYDEAVQECVNMEGCYRLGDRNVFVNKQRCEYNCFRNIAQNTDRRECNLNPAPGVCRDDQRRIYWSYNKKTGSCMKVEGCYSIRDRNVWLTEDSCRSSCIMGMTDASSSSVAATLPDFMSSATVMRNGDTVMGRRGKMITRNMKRDDLTVPNDGSVRVITAQNRRNVNDVRNTNSVGSRSAAGVQTLDINRRNTVVDINRDQGQGSRVVSQVTRVQGQMPRTSESRSNSVRVVQVSGNNIELPGSRVVASLFRT